MPGACLSHVNEALLALRQGDPLYTDQALNAHRHHVLGLCTIRAIPRLLRQVAGIRGVPTKGQGDHVVQFIFLLFAVEVGQQVALDLVGVALWRSDGLRPPSCADGLADVIPGDLWIDGLGEYKRRQQGPS